MIVLVVLFADVRVDVSKKSKKMPGSPSAYYILDLKGKNIIHRDFRGNLPRNIIEKFVRRVIKEEEENIQPVFEEDGYSFCYIQKKDLYCKLMDRSSC